MRISTLLEAPGKSKRLIFLAVFIFCSVIMTLVTSSLAIFQTAECQLYMPKVQEVTTEAPED